MIKKSTYCISLTRDEFKSLRVLKDWTGKMWDKPPNENIVIIKDKIRYQLENVQKNCAYCGLKLKGTSRGQIEHIAPKAYFRYPEFTFTTLNLVLACGYCNGFDKKGSTSTVRVKHKLYRKCVFNIVHPYFDDPDDFYEWDDKEIEIIISIKKNLPIGIMRDKAINSLTIFKLDSSEMSEHRAAQVRFEEIKLKYPLTTNDESLLGRAIQK